MNLLFLTTVDRATAGEMLFWLLAIVAFWLFYLFVWFSDLKATRAKKSPSATAESHRFFRLMRGLLILATILIVLLEVALYFDI